MANEQAKRDQNFVPTGLAITDNAAEETRMLRIDDTTKGLKVTMVGGAGTGDVTGPGSSTDNAVARFDGTTGKTIQNSAVIIADTTGNISGAQKITLGVVGTATGSIEIKGTTSGTVTVKTADAAGTWTLTLPANDGDAGQVLTTDGAGVTTWETAAGGGANTALSNLAAVAINTALLPDAAAADDFGSATLPFKDIFLAGSSGTPGTNNFRLTGASTSGTRVITLPDATDTLVGKATTDALTNKTVNGLTITSSTGTFTLTNGKTLSVSNTLTLAGTDGTTMTFPSTTATIARTDAGQTFTGVQVMTSPSITTSITTGSTTFALLNDTATTINFAGASGAVVNFGGGASASELRFLEPSGSGTNYTALKAQAQGANITYTLPATVGAAGTVLTDAAGNGTLSWATPSAASTPKMHISSIFETAARFSITNTNAGMTAFGSSSGADVNATSTASSASSLQLLMSDDAIKLFAGSPTFSVNVRANALNATGGQMFFGIGNVAVDGTSHTFTNNHIGFKIVESGGTKSLYATQADGTTENASSALTTVATTDYLTLILKVNSTTSVDYYWQKSGGSLSSATNLTSNLPTANTQYFTFSTTNAGSANTFDFIIDSVSYER